MRKPGPDICAADRLAAGASGVGASNSSAARAVAAHAQASAMVVAAMNLIRIPSFSARTQVAPKLSSGFAREHGRALTV